MMNFSLLKYKNPVFIETGTFHGTGVRAALFAGFSKIYSIELKKEFYEECQCKFQKEIRKRKVELFLGDSSDCLTRILKQVNQSATFWLDAHYSSGDTARGLVDVPLMMELNAISKHHIRNHTILIDDVRLFGKKGSEDFSNIQLETIIEQLKKINKDYSIFYENGICKNDVLVAEAPRPSFLKIFGRIDEIIFPRIVLRNIKNIVETGFKFFQRR